MVSGATLTVTTTTTNRVIYMEEPVSTTTSSGTPSVMEKSPLEFSSEDPPPMIINKGETKTIKAVLQLRCIPGGSLRQDEYSDHGEANAPPKVLRNDHAFVHPAQDTRGGKSLAAMGVGPEPPSHTFVRQSVSDPDPLSYAEPQPIPDQDIAQSSKGTATEIPIEGVTTTKVNVQFSMGSPKSGRSTFAPFIVGSPSGIYQPGWGVTNDYRLDTPKYNINLARQVALGTQLRLRFEQEVRLLKKARAQNLETLLEAEFDMKKATEAKNAELAKELESLRAKFSDLKLNNNQLSAAMCLPLPTQAVSAHVVRGRSQQGLAWVFGALATPWLAKGGINPGVSNNKLVKALQDLKDLKYPMVDQLEKLKDAPMELIMASLHLKSDTGKDAPQWIRDLCPSSSQLKNPHTFPEKKKCRMVCRTYGIGSAHHASTRKRSEDEASLRLFRSKSLPPMYNLDWP
ncbi:hypothetical protein Tco_0711973 [Tanacetum coccineum]